jgi:glutamate-1-semialdehyde 2,1-aminomutase
MQEKRQTAQRTPTGRGTRPAQRRTKTQSVVRAPGPTPGSKAAFERADRYFAGGGTRGGWMTKDYPIFIDRGEGPYVWDVDGNRYIDFINSSFALAMGHNYPAIREAIARQVEKGTFFTAHNETETDLAEELCRRVPSFQKVRFCCSGTEATMFAIRAARAYTGRKKVAKMIGGFHGTNDDLSTSLGIMSSGVATGGEDPVKQGAIGILEETLQHTVLLSFNNPSFTQAVIERHKKDLAAVIVEPVMGAAGMIPPRDGYLGFLREITKTYGIPLIFDEMISLGIAAGGAQEHYGVTPDMTCCGKVVGGGMPIGCIGGSEEIMEVFDPRKRQPWVNHGGTFAGHPLSMVSGLAQQRAMTPEVYRRLHELGERLRARLQALVDSLRVKMHVTGVGQLFCYHLTDQPVRNWETAAIGDHATIQRILDSLTRHGIHQVKTSRGSVSYAMTDEHVDAYVDAMEIALHEVGLAK